MPNLLSKAAEAILADAVHAELYASHLYRHAANQMQRAGYFGAAKWFKSEAATEAKHYQRLADYANDMGSVVTLPTIEGHPDEPLTTLRDALQLGFQTERNLLDDYAEWFGKADPVTAQFLLQFIEIQRKSVGEYLDWLTRLDRAGSDNAAMLLIDKELGE